MTRYFKKKPSNSDSNESFKKSFVSMHVDFCDSQNNVGDGETKAAANKFIFCCNCRKFFEIMLPTNEIKILSSNRQTIKLL